MRTVYTSAKSGVSINQIGRFVALQKIHNLPMGTSCNTKNVFTKMIHHFGQSMHTKLVNHLRTGTGPVALVADSSTDHGNIHFLTLLVQGMFDTSLKEIKFLQVYIVTLAFLLPLCRLFLAIENVLLSTTPLFLKRKIITPRYPWRILLVHNSPFINFSVCFYHSLRQARNLIHIRIYNQIQNTDFTFRYDWIFFPFVH